MTIKFQMIQGIPGFHSWEQLPCHAPSPFPAHVFRFRIFSTLHHHWHVGDIQNLSLFSVFLTYSCTSVSVTHGHTKRLLSCVRAPGFSDNGHVLRASAHHDITSTTYVHFAPLPLPICWTVSLCPLIHLTRNIHSQSSLTDMAPLQRLANQLQLTLYDLKTASK